jgi:hypothetical protein
MEDFVFSGGFEEAGLQPCFWWIYVRFGALVDLVLDMP